MDILINVLIFSTLTLVGYKTPQWCDKIVSQYAWLDDPWEKAIIPLQVLFIAFLWTICFKFTTIDTDHIKDFYPFLLSAVILSFAWLIKAMISVPRALYLEKVNLSDQNNLAARKVVTQFVVIERVIVFCVIILACFLILTTFESMRRLGNSLLASAGVLGVVMGFAAQKSISNIFAGIQIAITQPIRIDDVVIMEGEWGWIEEINLTYVVVRIWDQRRLIVPISQCIEKPFQNWTRTSADILGSVSITVDYAFPVDELRKETTRLLQDNKYWDQRVNVLHVVNLSDKAMEVRVLVSSKDSPSSWELRCYLRENLIDFCQKNYPQYLPRLRLEETEGTNLSKTKVEP